MVEVESFKKKIEQIISQEYKVEFLGKDFEKTVQKLTEIKADKIYQWIGEVVEKKIQERFGFEEGELLKNKINILSYTLS